MDTKQGLRTEGPQDATDLNSFKAEGLGFGGLGIPGSSGQVILTPI